MNRGPFPRFALVFAVLWAAVGSALLGARPAWALDPQRSLVQCARETWGRKDGLPEGPVSAIRETRDGFLWLGTTSSLARFDGQRFVSFDESRFGLRRVGYARDLLELPDGALYAALAGGVARGVDGQFTLYDERAGLTHPFVYALAPGPDGTVWVGTGGTGVWQLRDGVLTRHPAYLQNASLPAQINDLAVAPDGRLWAATSQGVLRLGDSPRLYAMADGLPGVVVRVLAFDREGTLWAGTRRGLARAEGSGFRRVVTRGALPDDDISALLPDREGTLWIGSYGGGLARLVGGRIEAGMPENAGSRGGVLALAEDRDGALWIGTAQGLERYRDGAVVTAGSEVGFGNEQILNVAPRRAGGLWVLDGAGALFVYENGRARPIAKPGAITGEGMLGLHEADDGSLWVGGQVLHHVREGAADKGDKPNGGERYESPGGEFAVIVRDGNGLLVAQTAGDGTSVLKRFEGGRFTPVPTPVPLVHVQRITRDRAQRLWISTGGAGLLRLDPGGGSRVFRAGDGLPHDRVYGLVEDDDGNIWVATRGGLVRIKNDRVDNLANVTGLPRRAPLQVQLDGIGALWVTADDGIHRIPLAELVDAAEGRAKAVATRTLTMADGLDSLELSWHCNGQAKTVDGRLWYATTRGLSAVDPSALTRFARPPAVTIDDVTAGGHLVALAPEVPIGVGRERIEIRFTAPRLTGTNDLRFRYRLEGYDADWVDASTRRVAYYTGVPAGSYRFLVAARLSDGGWGAETTSLALRILPRWNETLLARVLFMVAGALVLLGLYRLQVGRIRLQKRVLVKRVAERTAELQAEIVERQAAEDKVRRLNAELEARVRDRTAELETANLALAADVAARQRTEAALADEKEKLAVTLRSIAEGVVAVDLEGRVVMLNPVAEWLTGWLSSEAAGRPFGQVLPVVDRWSRVPLRQDPVAGVLRGREGDSREITRALFTNRAGRQILVDASAAPIHDGRGRVVGAVLVFRDVTEKTRADEQIQKTQKLEAVGILAGGIAHDFNNFLTGIFGHVDLARRALPPGSPALRWLDNVIDELDGARGLARQLLTFASGGAPEPASHSVRDLLDRSARFVLSGSGVLVDVRVPSDLARCEVDGLQVRQVIDNLLLNARQALPGGGHVQIVARNVVVDGSDVASPMPPGRYVEIAISDDGPGIPEGIRDRIFDPFFTTKTGGSGLGLATVRSIVAQYGGMVTFDSRPGAGTTFRILLRASPEGASRESTPPPVRRVPARPRPGARILVMDDEPHIRDLLKVGLELEGYEVELVGEGNEAVAAQERAFAEGRPFDLAILDLTIAGGSGGVDTLPRLRAANPALRAVASSGYARNDTTAALKASGFDGILPKPYTLDDLASIVADVLRPRPAPVHRSEPTGDSGSDSG